MVEVMVLLTEALQIEADPDKQELYRQAIEATSQENRAAVNYVEGVMGGGYGKLDLTNEKDRDFLLGALTSAVSRGLFVS